MSYYLFRFYNSGLERWLNQDPIMEEGFLTIAMARPHKHPYLYYFSPKFFSQDSNPFEFVENAPVNLYDYWGLTGRGYGPGDPAPKPPPFPYPPAPPRPPRGNPHQCHTKADCDKQFDHCVTAAILACGAVTVATIEAPPASAILTALCMASANEGCSSQKSDCYKTASDGP